jgi:hypothetical protein
MYKIVDLNACDRIVTAAGLMTMTGIRMTGVRMTGIHALVSEAAAATGADTAEVEASGLVKGFAGSQQAVGQLSHIVYVI